MKIASLFIIEAYHAGIYFHRKSLGHISTTLSKLSKLMVLVPIFVAKTKFVC